MAVIESTQKFMVQLETFRHILGEEYVFTDEEIDELESRITKLEGVKNSND